MIPAHIDTDEARSFLEFWGKLGEQQPQVYPDFAWFQICVALQQAEIADRPPLGTAEIAKSLGLPPEKVARRLDEMEQSRYVRREGGGWLPDEGAWLALELFMPTFKRILAEMMRPAAE